MYAIIRTGGKQYKVAEKDVIELERLSGDAGDQVAFGDVLALGGEDGVTLGSPLVSGARVAGEIVEHTRSATILVFKKRRRQNSKRSRGHRQEHTVVRITEILTDGRDPSRKTAARKAKAEAPAEAAPADAEASGPKAARPKATKPRAAKPKAADAAAEKPKAPRKPRAKKSEE
jgi:large subunit ribosomal protein L21